MSCCAIESKPPRTYRWLRIGFGILLAANSMLVSLAVNSSEVGPTTLRWVNIGLLASALVIAVLLAPPLIARAFAALWRRQLTTEALFIVAVSASLVLSALSLARGTGPTYFEISGLLLVVYSLGNELSGIAKRRALRALEHLRPDKLQVQVVTAAGLLLIPLDQVKPGTTIRLSPNQTVPVDGIITLGAALIREAELTGEPIARRKTVGDPVIAGTRLIDAALEVRVEAVAHRLIDRVAQAVAAAKERPSGIERLADRVAARLFPLVLAASLVTAIAWGLLAANWERGIESALAVLLIACPCALGFAAPLVLWRTTSTLARRGLALRSGLALETLAATDTIVFDKTGTLTLTDVALAHFSVYDETNIDSLKALIAAVEMKSDHPFAAALASIGAAENIDRYQVDEVRVVAGQGIRASVLDRSSSREHLVEIGPSSMLVSKDSAAETIAVLVDGVHRADAEIGESLRPGAELALHQLAQDGFELHLLSGDRGERVAAWSGSSFTSVTGEVGPLEKHKFVENLRAQKRRVLFVGDGVNDAASLAAADVGLSMRSGTELAIESADGSIDADLSVISPSIADAQSALRFARSLIGYAVIYNAIGIVIAGLGLLHPIVAAVLMATSSVGVTLRATVHDERPHRALPNQRFTATQRLEPRPQALLG